MKPLAEIYLTEMETKIEEDMMTIVQGYGLNVDKERLKQAIVDAKAFYDEGYLDGEKAAIKWIPVEEDKPKDFVSVLGHMTDAGPFPSVRECYLIDGQHFYFPALGEIHPVDKWMDMPEV